MGNIDQMTVDHILTRALARSGFCFHAKPEIPCQGYELLITELTPEGILRVERDWDGR